MSLNAAARASAIRGAKYGAIGVGGLSFLVGASLCLTFKWPIPPIAFTELGVIIGAAGGAGIALLWMHPVRRMTFLGVVAGLLVGALAGWLFFGGPMGAVRMAAIGALVGGRAAYVSVRQRVETPAWRSVQQTP